MPSCTECDKTFKKQGFLDRHMAKEHGSDAPPPGEADDDGECDICTDDAIARFVAFEINWKLCEGHLKVSLAYIEPL